MKERAAADIILAPSLLSADWTRAGEQVLALAEAGCQWLHFDAMDGHFVPNLSFGAMFLQALRPLTRLHYDAHLMVANPEERIEEFLKAGADSISVHVEGNAHLHRLISRIKDGGALAGAVLNPATPVSSLDVILPELDFVLVMSVNPGFGGQKFLPLALPKVRQLAQLRQELEHDFLIQIDGGVTAANAAEVVASGVDVIVSGSGLLMPGVPIAESVSKMRSSIESAFNQ